MFRRLRNKFLILNMSITCLVMAAAFVAIYTTTYNQIEAENRKKLNERFGMQVTRMENPDEGRNTQTAPPDTPQFGGAASGLTTQFISSDYVSSFTLQVDRNGNIVQSDSLLDLPQEAYTQAAAIAWNNKNSRAPVRLEGRLWQYAIAPVSSYTISSDGKMTSRSADDINQISFLDVTDTQRTLQNLLVTFVIAGLAMIAVIFLVSLIFANRSIVPVMEAWEKQRQFVADASHELKTPLSIINANYDAMLASPEETIQSQRKWFDYMKIGTDRMAKLINDLLTLATLENGNVDARPAPFDISAAIHEVAGSMEAAARDKRIAVSLAVPPGIMVNSEADKVKQLFAILYDNAVKYTNESGHIQVALSTTKSHVTCSVTNSGRGIPAQHLPRIFDRFYRADPSRTGETGGYGLGLSIARTIAHRLGGELTAASVENESATFRFILRRSFSREEKRSASSPAPGTETVR